MQAAVQPSLILVRHARPEVGAATAPSEWRLSAAGREAATSLAHALSALRPVIALSSPEPKARETTEIVARALAVAVDVEPDLAEHRRPSWDFTTNHDFRARVRSVLTEPLRSVDGAETGAHALARFQAVIARHPRRPLLIGSHGTILSLWLSRELRVDPVELWDSMGLPEAALLDASGRLIARVQH